MTNKLDSTDIKILELLQENSKITSKAIGEKLNLSPTPIFERIKKMEKMRYIEGYVALLNEKNIGLKQTVFAGISLNGHTRSYLDKFIAKVDTFPEVIECYQVTGGFDFLLKIVLEDIDAYQRFVSTKLSLVPELGNVYTYVAIKKGKKTNKLDLSSLHNSFS